MDIFETLKRDNRLLYHYIRGSHLYGLNIETSDVDTSAVFNAPPQTYIGLKLGYKDYISDSKHDNTCYELLKWVHGLTTSNPTMLESLFVPQDKILYNNGLLNVFFENKDLFLTKQIYNPVLGYAVSQIQKCMGLHKKCVNPMDKRKTMLEFCFVPYKQGATEVTKWLENKGMKQEYCGLCKITNMPMTYQLFYDWGAFFHNEEISIDDLLKPQSIEMKNLSEFISLFYGVDSLCVWYDSQLKVQRNYKGIVKPNCDSQEVRLSSILKEETPLITMTYNMDGYIQHCRRWKEYVTWLKERNESRYESNKEKTYDAKNVMHCFRILTMGIEILEGKGMLLNRKEVGDADFLLDIRNHKFEYEELIKELEIRKDIFKNLLETTTIPNNIDLNVVDNMLKDIQLEQIRKIIC